MDHNYLFYRHPTCIYEFIVFWFWIIVVAFPIDNCHQDIAARSDRFIQNPLNLQHPLLFGVWLIGVLISPQYSQQFYLFHSLCMVYYFQQGGYLG